jgi:hypothetical protein
MDNSTDFSGGTLRSQRWNLGATAALVTALLGAGIAGVAPAALAAPAATGPVSTTPVVTVPHLLPGPPAANIRQLVQCGDTMYAVGTFAQIRKGSTTYTRNNVFSFKATSPYTVSSWAPDVNGIVNSITFAGGNCADAYLGGTFSAIGSTTVKNIAEVDTTAGAVVTAFAHSAAGQVQTLASYGTHILVGGYYTSINSSSADPYMTSLNATTGRDDGFIHLGISGNYQYPGVSSNATRVYNQAISHGGTLDLVMGDFTSVGGVPRQQIFELNLATSPATVTPWTSPEWDGSDPSQPYQCAGVEPFYLQAAAWSPDDSTVYIATTGYHPWTAPTGGTPRTGLCDVTAAFPATQASVTHLWTNYSGCDSFFAAAADASAAYFGGHERWSQNPNDCDAQGAGALPAPGMEGVAPGTGALFLNSSGTAGLYSRSRGLGADDMLTTSAGLWIGSDNGTFSGSTWESSQSCGGVFGLAGICFLPYSG